MGGSMTGYDDILDSGFQAPKMEPDPSFAWFFRGQALEEETAVKSRNPGGQRNLWGKIILITLGFIVAFVTPLSFLFPLLGQKKESVEGTILRTTIPSARLCNTKECEFVSGLYRDALPQPCTDFYEYVCAQWKKREESFNSSVINQQNKKVTLSVIAILRDMLVPARAQTAVQKAAGLFQSCVLLGNQNATNQNPRDDILGFLAEHRATLKPQSTLSAWYLALDLSLNYGLPTLFDVRFDALSKDKVRPQVVLGLRPSFTHEHLRNETVVVNHLKWLGVEEKIISAISSLIKTTERYLVLVSEAVTSDNDPANRNMSVHPLDKLEEAITTKTEENWNGFIENITGGLLPGKHNVVFQNNHIKAFLVKVFRSIDARRLAVWVAFDVSWQLRLTAQVTNTRGPFVEKRRHYPTQNTSSLLRQQQCLISTSTVMPSATYSSYYHAVVTKDVVSKAVDMVTNIEDSLKDRIAKSLWMDEDMKKDMLAQLSNMKRIIGYPYGTQDKDSLNRFYAPFEDTGASFIRNWLSASRSRTRRALSQASEEDIIVALNEDMSRVSGKYLPSQNTMVISMGLLLPPFFDTVPPIDYASMGHFAAHEMMHAVYELHASRAERNSPTLKEDYTKRVKCVRGAYLESNDKVHPSSHAKDPEIVADFGALPVVYSAYARQKNRTNSPLRLQRLPAISEEQLFFIAFCYMWCSNVPSSRRYPEFKTRCNSLLKNMPEFSTAFNCPAGSPMNPFLKCTFW